LSIPRALVRRSLDDDPKEAHVQDMLLIYGSEHRWASLSEAERNTIYEQYYALSRELRAQGKLVSSHELQPTWTATTVAVRDGEPIVTDGPFAETKEALGAYYVIEAESLDEALAWAARIPSARDGRVEVRPVVMEHAEVVG
jgi:hypothetical protein